MSKYEVTTELTIAVRIKVLVESDDASSAIDAAVDLLPASYAPEQGKGWKADVTIKAPKGAFVFASQTPSDWRVVHSTRAKMRRTWPGWDRPTERPEPRERPKRPGRTPEFRGAWRWDGVRAPDERPIGATMADLWPKEPA